MSPRHGGSTGFTPLVFELQNRYPSLVKPFLAFLFFLATTIILGIGLWMAVDKESLWLLLAGVVGYLGLFARYGCQTH